jgi:4-amino-4-deoxy-L-arabinose transferase-like glycosyltransferase
MQTASRRYLSLILGLSLVFKLAIFFLAASVNPGGILPNEDALEYQQLAENLVHSGVFSRAPKAPFHAETIRTPGYPLFLAFIYHLFGVHPHLAIVIQIVLSLATIYCVYRITALLFHERAGVLAAALMALDPVSIFYSQQLMTETLFAFCLTVSAFFFVKALKVERGYADYAWGSFFLATATYTRPVSYYLGMIIPLFLFSYWLFAGDRKKAVKTFLLVLIIQAICVGGWQVRNDMQTGHAEFSHIQGDLLFYSRAAGIVAMRDGMSFDDAKQRLASQYSNSLPPGAKGWTHAQLAEGRAQFAMEIIKEHPFLYLWDAVKGGASLIVGPSNMASLFGLNNASLRAAFLKFDFGAYPPGVWLGVISAWAYGAGVLVVLYAGIVKLGRRDVLKVDMLFMILIASYLVVLSSGPEAYSRFRMPIMPILCVLSAAGYIRARRGMSPRAES